MAGELITHHVWGALTQSCIEAEGIAHVAVAYLGSQARTLLPLSEGSFLVVNASLEAVQSGQTSPSDLIWMHERGVRVHSLRNLHAKIFAFEKDAFIGSANASNNSKYNLIETLYKTAKTSEIRRAREFVRELCITELDADDLIRLQKSYRPPRFDRPPRVDTSSSEALVMELTLEQGRGRETQVQPPRAVWNTFFGLDGTGTPPEQPLAFRNGRALAPVVERRPIVSHHHVWTIEITGATPPRPAILHVKKVGLRKFIYSVFRRPDQEYSRLRRILDTANNPDQGPGRRWVVI